MKKIFTLFISVLLTFAAIAAETDSSKQKVTNVGFINVGLSYPSLTVKDIRYELTGNPDFKYTSYQHLLYLGLGYRTKGKHKSPFGFMGIVNYEQMKVDYNVQYRDSASQQYNTQRSDYYGYISISPGLVFDKETESGIIFHAALVGKVAVCLGETSYSYGSLGVSAGIGYGAVILNAGYYYGLNNIFRYYSVDHGGLGLDMDMRVKTLTIGLIIFPKQLGGD